MATNCGDTLSLQDLQTAKKHQIFEAEVITGKAGGVAGGADIDYATNQVTEQTQKTLPAVLRDAGFEPASFDFTTGGTLGVNDRNKLVYDPVSKTWYAWKGALPHVVAAATNPVGNVNWSPFTDPKLRDDIAIVSSVQALMAKTPDPALINIVKGYVTGTSFGGGQFYWSASTAKSTHNGITIFSPTVPWNGTYATLAAFLAGTGESSPSGTGCWVRMQNSRDMLVSWGGVDISGVNATDAAVIAVINYANTVKRSVRFDSGATIKCGFTSLVQHFDKFNLNLQCSFVLQNVSGIKIYAENDVEFNTDHPTYAERVVFRLKNCHDVEFSGFNYNSEFTDYSINPTDTVVRHGEWWKGFTLEGCYKLKITNQRVNAPHVFCMADNTNLPVNQQNKDIYITDSWFKYVVNYCFISREIEHVTFDRNYVQYQGRTWHTFGEACAPTTNTRHISICYNTFLDQIAWQSCITPGPHIESGLISGNYCKRHFGLFLENGSTSNLIITNNTSISTGERLGDGTPDGVHGTTHILLVGEVDDQPTGGSPHSNVLIQGNRFEGGGYAVQEYNTGINLRTGFQIKDNQMIGCIPPIITNQSFIGIEVSGNLIKAPDDFPDLTIAGQYPVIRDNTLIGVRVKARDYGYTIVSPTVTNNIFRANSLRSVFPALIDMTDFSGLVAEGNDVTAANFTSVIVSAANATTVGFKRLGVAEGFNNSPFTLYGAKLTCALGDTVRNSEPSAANNKYAWICVDGTAKTFGSLIIAI